MSEIKKHDSKLKKLELKEDWQGHLNEEICDVYILTELLIQLKIVNQKTLDKASKHFSDKVKEIYSK